MIKSARAFFYRLVDKFSARSFFFLLTLLICSRALQAQRNFSNNVNVAAHYQYGFVLPEYSNFTYLVNAPIQSLTLQLSKNTTGKNDWERLYNYPTYGVALYYSTLGNNQVHGKEWAFYPFFHLNIISRSRFHFYNQTGFGFGYITKKFDLENNYLNVAVGSHVNLHFNLKFGFDYKLTETVRWHSGLAFDHFSNGNLSEPNLGINWTTFYTGLAYRLGHHDDKISGDLAPHETDFGYEFIYSAGGKHPRSQDSRFYFTSSATFETKWKLFRALHLGLGADVFYDASTETEMLGRDLTNYKAAYDFRTGIHFSQEFIYSKLSLILQEGIYLLMTDRVSNKVMYNRWVVRYRVSPPVFVQVAMKSHLHILDYPEFGLGLKW
jgi:Lipid A 3-O-deacylase (PagL)